MCKVSYGLLYVRHLSPSVRSYSTINVTSGLLLYELRDAFIRRFFETYTIAKLFFDQG
jgi:hypothetical protein